MPRPASSRRAASALPVARLLLCLLLPGLLLGGGALAGCGGQTPPGGHGSLITTPGQPDLLVLEGSPYEMGWWQGHLLRRRIVALHERWEALLFQATAGGGPATDTGAIAALRAHCALCEDQTRHNLSEPYLQELDGMAAATGLEPKRLLWLDVLRDALRMKGLGPRLLGAVGVARTPAGLEARAWWTGADAALLAGEALVVQRTPERGPSSLCLSWPGSLGALAAVLADGRGYLLADVGIQDGRKRGFGAGRPLNVAAREALPGARDAGWFMASAKATMGHALLGFSWHPERDPPLRAQGGIVYYVDPPAPEALEDRPFLAVAPYETEHDPRAQALREGLRLEEPAGDLALGEIRWAQLQVHADGEGRATGEGLRVRLRYEDGRASLEAWGTSEAPRRATLAPAGPVARGGG